MGVKKCRCSYSAFRIYRALGIGRFASADTLVPNPENPQSFNRYAYVNNNPVALNDPSGHCAGYYDLTSGVASEDQECWDFLYNDFCIGGICTDWKERIGGFEAYWCGNGPCLGFGENYWSEDDLRTLSESLFLAQTTLNNAGFDGAGLLGGIMIHRTHSLNFSIAFPQSWITLANVDSQTIWHEIGHVISFRNDRALQEEFNNFVDGFVSTPWFEKNDFCYRHYCHYNDYPGWQKLYTGEIPEYWSDAFSAWVYSQLNVSPPHSWIRNDYTPNWDAILRGVEWSLMVTLTD